MLNIPSSMIETPNGKIQWSFVAQFLPALLLGVSHATKAENAGG
jgi:hypothetical protein